MLSMNPIEPPYIGHRKRILLRAYVNFAKEKGGWESFFSSGNTDRGRLWGQVLHSHIHRKPARSPLRLGPSTIRIFPGLMPIWASIEKRAASGEPCRAQVIAPRIAIHCKLQHSTFFNVHYLDTASLRDRGVNRPKRL